jgi:putative phage-type endonuclease
MEQRTDEWFTARLGKVTASRVADVISKTKSGPSASRANYLAELVAERLTGNPAESFKSSAMQWGIDTEAQAILGYEVVSGQTVKAVGFVEHPTLGMTGASPDGLIGLDGLIEVKCPNTATQIDLLLIGKVPQKYVTQMQWQMACTGRKWCEFVSFDPRLPANMQFFIKHVVRDDDYIAMLELEVSAFLDEVSGTVDALQRAFK